MVKKKKNNEYTHFAVTRTSDVLYHHGIKGMKWGVRRYQNKDGSLKSTMKKYDIAKKELKRNKKLTRRYVNQPLGRVNPLMSRRYKKLSESDARLMKKTEDFLSTLNDKTVKSLLKIDEEHGRDYVDERLFNRNLSYDSIVPISKEFADRYR